MAEDMKAEQIPWDIMGPQNGKQVDAIAGGL